MVMIESAAMQESDWQDGIDPEAMLRFARGMNRERKHRQFVCACWRRLEHLFINRKMRKVLDLMENALLAPVAMEDLEAAWDAARQAAWAARADNHCRETETMALLVGCEWEDHAKLAFTAGHASQAAADWAGKWARDMDRLAQCDILRDIFGNPFRDIAISPIWRTWNEGAARKLARVIHADRSFDQLPILGDALEEAGCDDEAILAHCRESGVHVRGCWVLELLLEEG